LRPGPHRPSHRPRVYRRGRARLHGQPMYPARPDGHRPDRDRSATRVTMSAPDRYDVAILGAGLAGLTLARQLLLNSDKTVLLLDKRPDVPGPRQKVGESTVQVGAFYYAKVLDLEEYLLHGQLMKYNLRFYWKSPGRDNSRFEDYGHAFIRTFSNIPCYQ